MKGLEGAELAKLGMVPTDLLNWGNQRAMAALYNQLGPYAEAPLGKAIVDYTRNMGMGNNKDEEVLKTRAVFESKVLRPLNQRATRVRDLKRSMEDPNWLSDPVMEKAMAKSTLDVGTLTNFANVTGGQSLGYVSLDTRMARGTVRPSSFTLYQALDKSLAWQVVDFWTLAKATGGAPPGAAFANYTSVSSGSLVTSAGTYDMQNIILKLALDGRAITTALAAQNNYVNVSEQENTNAALTVLETMDWASYHGNSSIFANQFDGISRQLALNAPTNIYDFYTFSANYATSHSWSPELCLYNLIYQSAAAITSYGNYGHITHAFMDPTAMGALQGLTNTQLNNILSQITELQDRAPLVVNGNLIGMQTRFGHIQFPLDLFISARDIPVQAIVVDGTNQATSASPTPAVSITGSAAGGAGAAGTNFNGSYTPSGGGTYMYAVASANASSLESTLVYSSSGLVTVTTGQAVTLTITPPGNTDAQAFRIFRSGLGGCANNASPQPSEFRYIGAVAANGASTVQFVDLNGGTVPSTGLATGKIPGSSDIFLLDMDPVDLAIDFRMLLPLVRVELFASNLFMPWAVASIGAIRLRVPKFHGFIRNYVPTNPVWNPLAVN